MIVTEKIRRTFVVEMTEEQRDLLVVACHKSTENNNRWVVKHDIEDVMLLEADQMDVLNDLRNSLLNS